ncbi:hypothetical protein [Enhygromyxa salina]|nr:hypothetical protein [Enhygromyxa salina]
MNDQTNADPKTHGLDAAFDELEKVLGPEGWRVYRKRDKVKARWRWYKVTLKYQPNHPVAPWRARMRDGLPVMEKRDTDPLEALRPIIAHAIESARFCEGRLGLLRNPSKSYLGHRLLRAVRPR